MYCRVSTTGRCAAGILALLRIAVGALIVSSPALAGGCKLTKVVEFPITMLNMRPMLTAKINDVDVQFVVDSGAFYSMISAASAAELKLRTEPAPMGMSVRGVNGTAAVSIATVKTFTLAGYPLHGIEFLAGGTEPGQGSTGLLGQNFLHLWDVEYDLGQGLVRLMNAQDCSKAFLGYWVGASTPYSVINLASEPPPFDSPGARRLTHTIGHAFLNGTEIRVWFDTGAGTSILSLQAAARAGIKPDSPGVVSAGMSSGVGRNSYATYIAPFSSFKIGDEEIRNTHLRIGGIDLQNADMLIGADFFLSHRIYVANSQGKLYFTYNGGPVFDLATGSRRVAEAATNASPQEPANPGAATEDAGDYFRRGAAFASRREFDQALPALTRACELAPDHPEYWYQRGIVYWQSRQPDAARADFDQALKLKPDDVRTLIARAELLLQRGEKEPAAADLDAADASAAKEADERFEMAHLYETADRLTPAVAQITLWIASHADDARLPYALNTRCWLRALEGADLPLALKDCNAALRRADKSNPLYAQVADSRGLVYLRMGAFDKSIADYDTSLKIHPRNAWSLYGRGIDELRKQESAAGNADLGQATALSPKVAEEFNRRGITP
jgi:tetratricopeptide (TPR) repeat protein/predicted aspartyl protease